MEQQLKQFNIQLPAWLIAAVHKRVSEILAQTAEKIPTGEIVGQALVFWLGPFETSNIKDAVFKAKIEAARPMLQKEIEGKSVDITLTSKDVADLIRQLRKAVEMDASIIDEGLTQ